MAVSSLWALAIGLALTACSSSDNCREQCTSSASIAVTRASGDFVAVDTTVVIEGEVDGAPATNRCRLSLTSGTCESVGGPLVVQAAKATGDRVTALTVFPTPGAARVTFRLTSTVGAVIVPSTTVSLTYDEQRVGSCSCKHAHTSTMVP